MSGTEEHGSDVSPEAGGGGQRYSLRNLRTITSLKNPVFRKYFAASLIQNAGMSMQMVARSLLVYRLTGSAAILGGLALANAVPMLALALFGGIVADRFQKKNVVLIGHATSALVSFGVALALTSGYLGAEHEGSWWVLMVASGFQGAIMGLSMPSRESLIREIVPAEDLLNAISLSTMGMSFFRLFAPAVTGFIIDAYDFKAVYFVMTALYVAAALLLSRLPRTSKPNAFGQKPLAALRDAFRYLRGETTLLLVIGFLLLGIVLSQPYSMLLPIFTEDVFGVGASKLGVLMSVSGLGAIVGSLTLASLPNKHRGAMLLGSGVILSLALIGFSLTASWGVSLGPIVFVGLGQTGMMTLAATLIQYYVDPQYLGRVMSILMMQFGFVSAGVFAAGLLAEAVGVQLAVGGFAAAMGVMALLAVAFVPRLRRLQ